MLVAKLCSLVFDHLRQQTPSIQSSVVEDEVAVLDDKLDSQILRVHVSHFPLDAEITHNGWRKNDGQVLGRHLSLQC
jgi:hypothetical protein